MLLRNFPESMQTGFAAHKYNKGIRVTTEYLQDNGSVLQNCIVRCVLHIIGCVISDTCNAEWEYPQDGDRMKADSLNTYPNSSPFIYSLSLPCARAYVALFARRLAHNPYAIAHAYNAANAHAQGNDRVYLSQKVTLSSKAIGV